VFRISGTRQRNYLPRAAGKTHERRNTRQINHLSCACLKHTRHMFGARQIASTLGFAVPRHAHRIYTLFAVSHEIRHMAKRPLTSRGRHATSFPVGQNSTRQTEKRHTAHGKLGESFSVWTYGVDRDFDITVHFIQYSVYFH